MRRIALFALVALPAFGRDHIGGIEFFGYKGIDLGAVQKAIPMHVGDAYAGDETKDKVRKAVTQALRRGPTDVEAICCNEDGDRVIFVGLPGSSSKSILRNPEPRGAARLSNEIGTLNDRLDQALHAAVQKGGDAAREDDSTGYALVHDPAARALQLKLRDYALAHEDELLRVLKTCPDERERAIAARAVGYVSKSAQQVAALVKASRDAGETVRDEAIRALGVLVRSDTTMAAQIPTDSFIEMLSSATWTDRNKASFLLQTVTRDTNPVLLAKLQARAMDGLMEMAKWRDLGHAVPARILLGRIASIPEESLLQLAWGPIDPILAALHLHDEAPR